MLQLFDCVEIYPTMRCTSYIAILFFQKFCSFHEIFSLKSFTVFTTQVQE